ncbi:MurR/RpiR family transcriptional regulator [Streptomyces sp. WMMB 322]|uniref:MurR/RpiR family transcriptional regulator n=1 Tax=Streptomyces sp. WMMB 322 TaxID=1286821 RepID=UPI0006E4307E|nr:MurR/RpiR family transcriptional regulator [Streptomyces sp. WMMB 322]SCK31263.1 transcriptional regulator, RpiR family [Streptomyces sp. WMMB 322]
MTSARTLAEALGLNFANLPPKQQVVAQFLARDPAFVAFASAAEVARHTGVDTATVVRTCQNLGYDGWRELHQEVKRNVNQRRTFADRVATLETPAEQLTERVFEVAANNVTATLQNLDHEALESAARAVSGANLVVVAAGGVSSGPGQYLASSLQIIGLRAVLTTGAGDAAPGIAPVRDGDVVIGISMWRYLKATVQTLEHALRTDGVTAVAITDSPVAPAAVPADHILTAQTETAGPRLGLTGIMALLEVLVARVALLDPERSRRASRAADELYFADNVLAPPKEDDERL